MVSIFARKKPCQNWLWKTAHLNRKDKSKSKGSRLALTLVYSPRSANRSSHFSFFSNSAIIGSVGAFCFFPLIIINGCCQLPSCVCVCVLLKPFVRWKPRLGLASSFAVVVCMCVRKKEEWKPGGGWERQC